MTYIIGIDLSWSSTGIVCGRENQDNPKYTTSVQLNQHNKKHTMSIFKEFLNPDKSTNSLYVIEDYNRGGAYQNPNSLIAMAELRGILELFLEDVCSEATASIIYVAPTQLKKFITGSGKGDKAQIMKEVYKRWKFDAKNSDEADAFGLFKIGYHLIKPNNNDLIKPQQEVLDKLYNKYKLVLEN